MPAKKKADTVLKMIEDEIQKMRDIIREKDTQIDYLNKMIKALSAVDKMTTQELQDAEKNVKAQEHLTDFSIKELKQRDISLRNVLEVNKDISSILDKEKLLNKILDGLIVSLKAQRGILYTNTRESGIVPTIFNKITGEEIKKDYFRMCLSHVLEAAVSRKTVIKMMEELADGPRLFTISFICLPLIYENRLLGVMYVDIISDIKTFRIQDLDIAEIFSSQAAISLNNASLYEKINGQNLELLKLINLKDQFINELSKNIQKPLKRVRELVEGVPAKPDSCEEMVKESLSLVDKMDATVQKFLTIQELEKEVNDLFTDLVNFKELFQFIIQCHETEIVKRNITVKTSLTPQFEAYHANKSIMRTIFDELISNSVFYNRQNGTVEIKGYKSGDYLCIDIADTGHGIREEDKEKIFGQFNRTADSAKLNDKGAGLGLFLARKFIKYYNGDITVESQFGKGSTFTVKMLAN